MFVLWPYAAVKNGYVTRFINDPAEVNGEELCLPVVADELPAVTDDQRIWGPEFEVLGTHVRAYGRAVQKEPDELLLDRINKLDALIAAMEARGA